MESNTNMRDLTESQYYKTNITKKGDVIFALVLVLTLTIIPYFFLSIYKYGFGVPLVYYTDAITQYVTVKRIGDNGWFWFDDFSGAPYGANALDFYANCLANSENAISKLIYYFAQDPIVTTNIQFLLTFPLCGISAYIVLRILKCKQYIAFAGAIFFGLAPYIFWRGVGHYCLSACYFVPLSALLCVWSFEKDERYMVPSKSFFKYKKNVISIVMALLIANNGIGYYPFFTCFFLCVVALIQIPKKRWKIIIKPLGNVVFICAFTICALLPSIINSSINGGSYIASRAASEAEMYGLKIVQLFIPTNGHNIPVVEHLIHGYNSNMPLVNENASAYLGIAGISGLLISLLILFCVSEKDDKNCKDVTVRFFSKLNLAAILFATIGGFSSIFHIISFAFGHAFFRGYNRISIFILFFSIVVLCLTFERIEIKILSKPRGKTKPIILGIVAVLFFSLCIFDLTPTLGSKNEELKENNYSSQSDRTFIESIDRELQDNDMVFQLPYHAFPESGPVREMSDYDLLIGRLYSSDIKWSFGGTKGRESDLWCKNTSRLSTDKMISRIIAKGFKGIYIDTRAYDDNALNVLCADIENTIGYKPIISKNKNLMFYNLYPYIRKLQNTK